MTRATSAPYAPTFWIGVAPAEPGIPDSASTPDQPDSTAVATNASHGSPAQTRTRTRPEPSGSAWTPRVPIRTTVPGNPASATSRFEPPPTSSRGSPVASAAVTASIRSPSEVASMTRRAGPPTRRVVMSARTG